MSADNWTICPKCLENKKIEYAKAFEDVENSYGEVSYKEFKKLEAKKKKALTAIDNDNNARSLREDYEFFMTPEGILEISYLGRCSECGAEYKFNKKVDFSKE